VGGGGPSTEKTRNIPRSKKRARNNKPIWEENKVKKAKITKATAGKKGGSHKQGGGKREGVNEAAAVPGKKRGGGIQKAGDKKLRGRVARDPFRQKRTSPPSRN